MKLSSMAKTLLSIAFFTIVINCVLGSSNLPPEFANTNLTLEDVKTLIRNKCVEVAGKEEGEAAFTEIENAVLTLRECKQNILTFTPQEFIEFSKASSDDSLLVFFNKYCNKQTELLTCVSDFNNKLAACLDKEEKEHLDVFKRIIKSLLSPICHKGGEQTALFIAEKGPECLYSKKDDVQNCINLDLEKCIVQKLETCSEITPANIMELMFRLIKNETIYHNAPLLVTISSGVDSSATTGGVIWLIAAHLLYQIIKSRVQT